MHLLVFALIFSFIFQMPAHATEIILQAFATATAEGVVPSQAMLVEVPFNNFLGMYAWEIGTTHWAEVCGGLMYSPAEWCRFFGGAGVEQADSLWRLHSGVAIDLEQLSFFADMEVGGAGLDFRSEAAWHPVEWIGLGYTVRRFEGIGPRFEVLLPYRHPASRHDAHTAFTLWATPYIYEPEKNLLFPGGIIGMTAKI